MEVFSIGFAKRNASDFFGTIKSAGIQKLVDVRLNNTSQLAGFTKREDLPFFLSNICGASYLHEPLFAPTQEMLDNFKKKKGSWQTYEKEFLDLIENRKIEDTIDKQIFETPTILLCSENTASRCHRRLVLEYLSKKWGTLKIVHL